MSLFDNNLRDHGEKIERNLKWLLIKKDAMLTNSCYGIFTVAYCVLHFFSTHFQDRFSLNSNFINKFLILFQSSLEHIFYY